MAPSKLLTPATVRTLQVPGVTQSVSTVQVRVESLEQTFGVPRFPVSEAEPQFEKLIAPILMRLEYSWSRPVGAVEAIFTVSLLAPAEVSRGLSSCPCTPMSLRMAGMFSKDEVSEGESVGSVTCSAVKEPQ